MPDPLLTHLDALLESAYFVQAQTFVRDGVLIAIGLDTLIVVLYGLLISLSLHAVVALGFRGEGLLASRQSVNAVLDLLLRGLVNREP